MQFNDYDGLPYRKSNRLSERDYTKPGQYFITICTKDRNPFFGEIRNGFIGLKNPGCIVWKVWNKIPERFESVMIESFIVMPNHAHGIIRIKDTGEKMQNTADAMNRVLTEPEELNESGGVAKRKNPMLYKNHLGRVVRWFKGRCTREIRNLGINEFAWHPRYHDRIIRNKQELNRIKTYINENPINWEDDIYYQ